MTVSIKKHAIALSEKEFALLEIVYKLGPCTSQQVCDKLNTPDLLTVMRDLHDLTKRSLLERPYEEGRLLYSVKSNYRVIRSRIIVMESSR